MAKHRHGNDERDAVREVSRGILRGGDVVFRGKSIRTERTHGVGAFFGVDRVDQRAIPSIPNHIFSEQSIRDECFKGGRKGARIKQRIGRDGLHYETNARIG